MNKIDFIYDRVIKNYLVHEAFEDALKLFSQLQPKSFEKTIIEYVETKHNVMIGNLTAKCIKNRIIIMLKEHRESIGPFFGEDLETKNIKEFFIAYKEGRLLMQKHTYYTEN